MSLGARIGAGRTAEVFALPGERVCKLFYPGVPAEAVEAELRGARCADAHGLAAPRCRGRMRALGREGIVFDRVRANLRTSSLKDLPLGELYYLFFIDTATS